jgi:hypothetical protein
MIARRVWVLSSNMAAAFLAGDGILVLVMPQRQTLLWSPDWSPAPWREFLRFLARRPRLTKLLAIFELTAGLALARMTNGRRVD